jgi:hypothetical protein
MPTTLNPNTALMGGMMGGPTGALLGGVLGRRKRKAPNNGQSLAQGSPDSWGTLLQGLQSGGQEGGDALTSLLQNFKGSANDMQYFLEKAAPFLAGGQSNALLGSDAYKQLNDKSQWDLGALSGYGPAAGQIAQGAQRSIKQGAGQLAASGLGRSAARSSMAQMGQAGAATDQSNLWSNVWQQAQRNRMQSAGNALDAHRLIAQMALGQLPTPRVQQDDGGNMGAIAGMAGGVGGLAGGIGSLLRLGAA